MKTGAETVAMLTEAYVTPCPKIWFKVAQDVLDGGEDVESEDHSGPHQRHITSKVCGSLRICWTLMNS